MPHQDPTPVEQAMQRQQASRLDDSLLDRLEAAADGSLLELSTIERNFETRLRSIRPSKLQPSFLQQLEKEASATPFPGESRVLPFPGNKSPSPARRSWLPMAAAVALLGALAALLLDPVAEPMSADGRPDPSEAPSLSPRQDIQPAQFSRDLSTAVDAGIIWPDNSQPHRVLKVVYTDRITMTREDGSSYQVEKPRVEYILVPAESH